MKSQGESCKSPLDCDGEKNLICISSICECPSDQYEWKDGTCKVKNPLKYGGTCRTSTSENPFGLCVDPSTFCGEKKCECSKRMIWKDGKCQYGNDYLEY